VILGFVVEQTMNSSSPAHSSISTTAVIGGGVGGISTAAVSVDDFHFPYDHISMEERKDEAMLGYLSILSLPPNHIFNVIFCGLCSIQFFSCLFVLI
jgi:hypothetical protein